MSQLLDSRKWFYPRQKNKAVAMKYNCSVSPPMLELTVVQVKNSIFRRSEITVCLQRILGDNASLKALVFICHRPWPVRSLNTFAEEC